MSRIRTKKNVQNTQHSICVSKYKRIEYYKNSFKFYLYNYKNDKIILLAEDQVFIIPKIIFELQN